jgi:hypothetical protein
MLERWVRERLIKYSEAPGFAASDRCGVEARGRRSGEISIVAFSAIPEKGETQGSIRRALC